MKMDIESLCRKVEATVSTARTFPIAETNQIIITFTNRPDIEIALLTPYAQQQLAAGRLDYELLADMLKSIRSVANVTWTENDKNKD